MILEILVFNAASLSTGGNVAPTRTLTTSSTVGMAAIFVDVGNDRLFAADLDGAIAIYDNASTLPTGAITAKSLDYGIEHAIG